MLRTVVSSFCLVLLLSFPGHAQSEFVPANNPRYDVDATALDIRIDDNPPQTYPSVGHLAAVPYDQAFKIWAERRFKLTGNSVNSLRVTLTEGRITEQVLSIKKGIKGWFKKEPATEYSASLVIGVAIIGPEGTVIASTDAKSWHTTSLVEGATPVEKDAALNNLVSETFAALDREIAPQFERHLGKYARPSN